MDDFSYLEEGEVYLDAACQSLRPTPVIEAMNEYYTRHNSCGERVKYQWGRRTDELVEGTREKVLRFLKLRGRDYFVSFTLNTTYGLNLILSQLKDGVVGKVMSSDIEHNSPFLATMAFAKRHGVEREVMTREADGSIDLSAYDFTRALVVVNCAGNFDGRRLLNLEALVARVHKQGGLVVIDAAQAMAHASEILLKTSADAVCFSAHKMYAPSLGVMVVRRDLLPKIETSFIGGGMVDDVELSSYRLSAESPNHVYTKFEAGLQAWGEIVGLGAAIDWLEGIPKVARVGLERNVTELFGFLREQPLVRMVNTEANPTMAFYIEGIDSHLLGGALSDENIMTRTGYFCAHYYLDHVMHYPPLVRFALGYHTRESDVAKVKRVFGKLLRG